MAITYMKRRASGIYEFRRMLPRSLAGQMVPAYARLAVAELTNPKTGRFKLELTVSLRTSEPVAAKREYAREQARVALLIETAQSIIAAGPPPDKTREPPDLIRLEEEMLAAILRADEEQRQQGDDRRHLQTAEERTQWPDLARVRPAGSMGMEPDHYEAKGEEIAELLRDYRRALAMQDARIVEPELNGWLRKNGRTTDPAAPWRPMAALAALRAHVKAYGLLDARQQGEDVPTPTLALESPSSITGNGPLLSAAFEQWRDGNEARGARKPSKRSVEVTEYAARLFKELHGDIPLGAISFEKARQFRDAYAKMPTRLTAGLKGKTMPELLAHPDAASFQTPGSATVNKLLGMLGAIISAAEREGQLDHITGFQNPFGKRVKLQVDDRAEDSRERFTAADLDRIFASPVYAKNARPTGGGGEAAFWLPLIALLSGARQNEIAELRLQDLAKDAETGVWHLDIGTEGGRSIKTASSRRKVPLHPVLIEVGILEYREVVTRRLGGDGAKPLWPDITTDSAGRRAGLWSKWFNRYLRSKAGIRDSRLVFHSFRHSFKRSARDAKISEEMHDAITGHASASVGSSYGKGFGLAAMLEALSSIPAPALVRGLKWQPGKWKPKAPPKPKPERTIKLRTRRRPARKEG